MGKSADLATQQANFATFMARLAGLPDGKDFNTLTEAERAEALSKVTHAAMKDAVLNQGLKPKIGSLYNMLSSSAPGVVGSRAGRGSIMVDFISQMGYDMSGKVIDGEPSGNAQTDAGNKKKKSYSMAPQQIRIEGIKSYRNSFLLLMAKFAKLKNPEQFDMLSNAKRKELFSKPELRQFVESPKANENLPRGVKISGLMNAVKARLRDSNLKKKGSTLPTMISLFGYDPETGEIIANREKQETTLISKKPLPEDTAIVGEPSPIITMATEAGASMAAAVKESKVIDCGQHFEAVHRALSETNAGETVALYLGRKPDKIFINALYGMGFEIMESYSKPSRHSLTGLEYDGVHLIIAKRATEVCNATPIMLANGVSRTNAILDEIHRLLDIAESKAKTTGEVELLHKIADDMLSLLKKEKAGNLHEMVLEVFTSIDARKVKADATDPEIVKMAKDILLNPALKNLGLAKQRKDGAQTARILSKR